MDNVYIKWIMKQMNKVCILDGGPIQIEWGEFKKEDKTGKDKNKVWKDKRKN